MADAKPIDDFLNDQGGRYYSFVISPGGDPSEVDVTPYSMVRGILESFRLGVPKSAIQSVTSTGIIVEISGQRHEVVNIVFADEVGHTLERVFEDLIGNASALASTPASIQEKSFAVREPYRPLRDWCGWHWPQR